MKKNQEAFTLIEMLVVIAIISIVAAMVAGMANTAKIKQHAAQVTAGKTKLVSLIEDYHSKLNFYPPDNGNLTSNAGNGARGYYANYDGWAATNPLVYELGGATNNFTNASIFVYDSGLITPDTYNLAFARNAVANANPDEPHSFYTPKSNEIAYYTTRNITQLAGFTVPVAYSATVVTNNFWHYDASSTNRHNLNSYDLWAEYSVGVKGGVNNIVTNGNW